MQDDDKKRSLKEDYERAGRAADVKAHQTRLKDQCRDLEGLLDPELNADQAEPAKKESGEWTELRKYIMIHFPEARDHANLSANQIMVGVASALGWAPAEIIEKSGLKRGTVYNWLKKAEVMYLIKEFAIKKGQEDPAELVNSVGYKALKMLDHVLSLPPSHSNKDLLKIQLDAAKFSANQAYGKKDDSQKVEIEVSYKDVAEQIHKTKEDGKDLSKEEEEELFH